MIKKLLIKLFKPMMETKTKSYIRTLEIENENLTMLLNESIEREVRSNKLWCRFRLET